MDQDSGVNYFQELDTLFDESPVNMGKIERILFKLTKGVVNATIKQRTEDLIAPYISDFSFIANEIRWRCEEKPENADLNVIRGRIEAILDVLEIAEDTSVSTRVILTVKASPIYLKVLQVLESKEGNEIPIDEMMVSGDELTHIIHWMEERDLIKVTDSIITFGPKGRRTLQAIRQEQATPN